MLFLQPHQKKAVSFILHPENRSVLLFYSLGSGKTIAALSMAKVLIEKYSSSRVLILAPASIIGVFEKGIKKQQIDVEKVHIFSYGIFLNKLKNKTAGSSKNTIVILDEAHNLNGSESITFKYLFPFLKDAFKIIMLSATPIKNSPEEMANQLSILNNKIISKKYISMALSYHDTIKKEKVLKEYLKCKVLYYNNEVGIVDNPDYPTKKEHYKTFVMDPQYYKEYFKIQKNIKHGLPDIFDSVKNLTVFLNGIRRYSNVFEPKIRWVVKMLNDHPNSKFLIYSNWLNTGIDIIKNILITYNIPFSEVTGSLTKEQKEISIKNYNSDKTKIILISSSGSEGLSLKNTNICIILEPTWNRAKLEQIIGRTIRFKSHNRGVRHVDIYHLIVKKPDTLLHGDYLKSADTILNDLSHKKDVVIKHFYKNLKDISAGNDPTCKT